MRNIINISLPRELTDIVRKGVKRGNFASTSEYIRHLIRSRELAEELYHFRDNFPKGWKKLRSLRDLR